MNRKSLLCLLLLVLLLPGGALVRAENEGASDADALSELEGDLQSANSESIAGEPLSPQGADEMERGLTELSGSPTPVQAAPTPAPPPVSSPSTSVPSDAALEELGSMDSPPSVQTPPPQAEAAWSKQPNEITNLEFKMEQGTSRVLVSSRRKLNYREVRNGAMKQVVYFFENTTTNQKLQRAYDTTEFPSPVALFTLLQMPNETPSLSKLIIQLREDKAPAVVNTERGIYIDFPPTDFKVEPRIALTQEKTFENGEANIYAADQKYVGKPIKRLEIKNSDIQDVLRLIAKYSGFNIVIAEDVTGKVGTMSIEDLPWDQAFALVLQSKKLGYVKQGNVIRVGTLASLKQEKEESIANEMSKTRVEPLKTLLIPISYAKAGELVGRAKPFLTERGTSDVDDRTNTIIIRDVEKATDRILKLYAALDTQPPKVSVSAKFVEMTRTFSRDLGMSALSGKASPFSGLDIDPLGMSTGANGNGLNATLSAQQFGNLNAQIRLGESERKVRVLANPSLAINSNQSGTITQGITYNYFIPTAVTAGGGVAGGGIGTITADLTMNVTPIVAGDGAISMNINIRNAIPDTSVNPPTTSNRNVQTSILVENGDTAVIGGVFQNTVNNFLEGTPFLMRIPIIGFFFSHTNISDVRSEILIFLTAKVLNAEESFKRVM